MEGLQTCSGDEGTEREWTVMTAGIKSQSHLVCKWIRFQSRQRGFALLCSLMGCCVFLSFPGWAAQAGFRSTAYILTPFGMNWKPTSPSFSHLVQIISWSSVSKQGDKKNWVRQAQVRILLLLFVLSFVLQNIKILAILKYTVVVFRLVSCPCLHCAHQLFVNQWMRRNHRNIKQLRHNLHIK